jgi:Skp family chaperone for outer membrane proteins
MLADRTLAEALRDAHAALHSVQQLAAAVRRRAESAVLQERERGLQEKYVKLQETYMQLQQGLVAEEGKLVKEIFAKAAPAIKSVAQEKGYVMVLDKSMVLWAGNGLDITSAVNKRIK